MGPLLGLGSKGKRRALDRALVCSAASRAVERMVPRTWFDYRCAYRKHCDQLFLVRRESSRCWPSYLWFYGRRLSVARNICGDATAMHSLGGCRMEKEG